MDKKKCVIYGLYEVLEKLRYPEIAETCFEDFESTILVGAKRLELLLWILKEDSSFNLSAFNKLSDSNLEIKLIKCYAQMGFVSNLEHLKGTCTMEKQLPFLYFLTTYMNTVHLENIDKENSNDTKNNFILNKNGTQQTSVTAANTSFKEIEYSKFLEDLESKEIDCTCNHDKLNQHILENQEKLSKHTINDYKTEMQTFYTAFKEISHLPSQDIKNDLFSESFSDFGKDIKQIQSEFTTVKKIVSSEAKIKNHVIPENFTKLTRPLSQNIKNNLVLAEQACNILKKNL